MLRKLTLADLVTLLNAFFGLLAVILVQNGFTYMAPVLILAAAIADGADGFLSRMFSASDIGANLDSLADVISFGLAPVAIVYSAAGRGSSLLFASLCFFFFCGILRLARFNSVHQGLPSFRGLPITAGGIILSVYVLSGFMDDRLAVLLAFLLGALMISNITYMKVRSPWSLKFVGLLFTVTVLSYPFDVAWTHILASVLLFLMVLYVVSPFFQCNKGRCVNGKHH